MEDRLDLLLKTLHLSPAQFADEIGLKRSGIYHIIKGRNKPGMDFFTKVLERFPEINAGWLLTGKGTLYKQENISMVEEPITLSGRNLGVHDKPIEKETTPKTLEAKEKGSKRKSIQGKKDIVKIVIFYDDGTFSVHLPG